MVTCSHVSVDAFKDVRSDFLGIKSRIQHNRLLVCLCVLIDAVSPSAQALELSMPVTETMEESLRQGISIWACTMYSYTSVYSLMTTWIDFVSTLCFSFVEFIVRFGQRGAAR